MRLSDLLYLQKSDRRALLFLLILASLAVVGVFFMGNDVKTTSFFATDSTSVAPQENQSWKRDTRRYNNRQWHEQTAKQRNHYIYNNVEGTRTRRFTFDPNTADSTQLLQLGLAPWQVRSIYHYRAKGGVYRTPDDFARVYGLTQKQFNELKPYIRISDDYQPAAQLVGKPHRYNPYDPQDRDTLLYPIKLSPNQKIVLNTADTTELKRVPGIGSGWARTIVNYGSYLGGYISVDQLLEIDGFPEELLTYFIVKDPAPKKLRVNELTLNQLKRHPYINFYQARAITDYRRLHGKLESLNQLKLLKDFPEEVIKRLEPYVEY